LLHERKLLADELFLLDSRLLFDVVLLNSGFNLFEAFRGLLRLLVVQQGHAQLLANVLVVSRDEVIIEFVRERHFLAVRLMLHGLGTTEACFHREDVWQVAA
jgi:hypothetical protein